jgi:large subunit ribosomal protein L13
MKSFQAKTGQLQRKWYVIDAENAVVGRLAAQIAPILMGKHRPTYTPHVDTGDYVVVVNAEKIVFTGNKWQQKTYERYTGYPGGHRSEAAWKLHQRHPERILEEAVRRMLPKNKLGRHMLGKLLLYVGPQHPHQAQQPVALEPLDGRPTADGILIAPPPGEPKRREKKRRPARAEAAADTEAATATATATLPEPEPALPAPGPADEAALPPPENEGEGESE